MLRAPRAAARSARAPVGTLSAAALAAVILLGGCGKAPAPAAPPATRDPLAVQAPAALLPGLQVGPPPVVEIRETLRVPGRIEVDERRVARVGASVTGRVHDIDVTVGQAVRRGERLASLTSTQLSAAQLDYLKSHSQLALAERAAQRAERLREADVIGDAELQRRASELRQANAEVSAARDQLAVLGMGGGALRDLAATRRVNSLATVVSSIDGIVIERQVTRGQVVQPADALFVVADLSSVWLVADVPEQRAAGLRPGQTIEAEVAALPGKPVAGKVAFVAAAVNDETRTVKVWMDLANPDRVFKPAMLATVVLKSPPRMARAVPARAVVHDDGREYVFVRTGPQSFALRQVALAEEHDAHRAVVGGLRDGEEVVLDGAFLLNVERQRQQTQ
jgi:cobalt-zinc-cadmium efflux system membrane fusion protein